MTEPRCHIRHALAIRRPGNRRLCLTGIEAWCRRYGIDPEQFSSDGVPGEVFAAIEDGYAAKVLNNAREEARRGG